jgi:hypothetical protein
MFTKGSNIHRDSNQFFGSCVPLCQKLKLCGKSVEKRLNERNARNGHVPLHQNLKLAGHWHGFWTFLLLIAAANFGGTWLTSFATAEKLVGVAMNLHNVDFILTSSG